VILCYFKIVMVPNYTWNIFSLSLLYTYEETCLSKRLINYTLAILQNLNCPLFTTILYIIPTSEVGVVNTL
jgi:hypothetical protein